MSCSCCEVGCTTESVKTSSISTDPQAIVHSRRASLVLFVRFIVAGLLFGIALILNLTKTKVPVFLDLASFLYFTSWVIAGYRVVFNALKNMLRRNFFDENFLMTVATLGAFIIGQWSEAAAVMLFYNLGEMIQESAVYRSRKSITSLMDVRPDLARLADTGELVHPSTISLNTAIRVLPGEKIPLDGIVIEGSSSLDTSALTGESIPRLAQVKSEVFAGFVNLSGLLIIETRATFADTAASKMLDLIEHAQNKKAKAERLISSFAKIYTPIVTLSALVLAFIFPITLALYQGHPLAGWASFTPWIERALVFLVISCPCAFVISVPLGFFGGIGGAAKKGILVKGADVIDTLAKARAVVFDKTGTLTEGKFKVTSVELAQTNLATNSSVEKNDRTAEIDFARLLFTAEQHSTHPLAQAIRTWASSLNIQPLHDEILSYTEHGGKGLSMEIKGVRLTVGSISFLREQGIMPGELRSEATSIELAKDGVWLGRVLLQDEIKKDSLKAIQALRTLGIKEIIMLTGDTEKVASTIAKKLKLDSYRAGVLPHQKVEEFERIALKYKTKKGQDGSVIFVGDGINDAPVLARSDVGIAMGGIGSDIAIESADLVLMNDNPYLVAEAIKSSRWTRHIVSQNIALSFIIKIGFLVLGALGIASLWEAVFADVGVALLATLNSVRARK